MTNPPFEVVIPAAPKDLHKLPFVIPAVLGYTNAHRAHIITPDPSIVSGEISRWPVMVHADQDVLDFDRTRLRYRPDWIFAMFAKLFQDVTETDWYLVIDADLIFIRRVDYWLFGRPALPYIGEYPSGGHSAYYKFNQQMLGYPSATEWSLISECTLYHKGMVRQMVKDTCGTQAAFLDKAASIIDAGCHPAEPELYGTYVLHEYPGLYSMRRVTSALGGLYGSMPWSRVEIQERVASAIQAGDVDVMTIHSWEGTIP